MIHIFDVMRVIFCSTSLHTRLGENVKQGILVVKAVIHSVHYM
jgi:hypothetical protein